MVHDVEYARSEDKRYQHPFRRLATQKFLRRRTTTDLDEKLASSSTKVSVPASLSTRVSVPAPAILSRTVSVPAPLSTTVPESEPSSPTVSTPRSRIPTPSASSRRHAFSSQLNAVLSPSESPQTKSLIPKSTTKRSSDGVFDAVSGGPILNQDGRYPFFPTQNQRRSDVEADQRPLRDLENKPIYRSNTLGIIMPPSFMSPTLSSAARSNQCGFAGRNNLVSNFSCPLLHRTQPDRDDRDDDETPTMRQVINFDDNPTGIIDPTMLGVRSAENVTSYSPPVFQYGASSDVPEESSAQTTGLASSILPSPNYGDYSFETSNEMIRLALTTPIPPEGDIIYETATEALAPSNFVMPERLNSASGSQDHWPQKLSTETTEESGIEYRSLLQMDEEDPKALLVSSQWSLPSPFTSPGRIN